MNDLDYLPYKAINVHMNNDFLRKTLLFILNNINSLSKSDQIAFAKSFRETISILGFRNPTRAPQSLQVNAYINAFEEKDEVIPFTLSTWAKIKADFAENVKNWLESEKWETLQIERGFEETEGFIQGWPESMTFGSLIKKFKETNPDLKFDDDELVLMTIWISGKLP